MIHFYQLQMTAPFCFVTMYNVFCKWNALRQKQSFLSFFLPSHDVHSLRKEQQYTYLIVSHHLQPHHSILLQLLVASQSLGDECQHRLTVSRFLLSLLLCSCCCSPSAGCCSALSLLSHTGLCVCSSMVSPHVDIQSARLSKGCAGRANVRLLPCVGSNVPPQLAGCAGGVVTAIEATDERLLIRVLIMPSARKE
jgi:hypothetical protein